MKCPLCSSNDVHVFHTDQHRPYHRCGTCSLIFVPRPWHLIPSDEKLRYDTRIHDREDVPHGATVPHIVAPLVERLSNGARGLDYGSGPQSPVAGIFKSHGFTVTQYDPFYADDRVALFEHYDFVTCTETIEHFCHPQEEWMRLVKLLKPAGFLGITTTMYAEDQEFSTWPHKDDSTHVGFYTPATFTWIASNFGLSVELLDQSLVLLRCQPTTAP